MYANQEENNVYIHLSCNWID